MNNTNTPISNALIKLIVERSKEDFNRLTLKIPNYSPFFSEVVQLIKKLPGRRYHSIRRNWSIPFDRKTIDELILLLGPNLFFTFNWQMAISKLNDKHEIPNSDSSSKKRHQTLPIKEKPVIRTKNQDRSLTKRRSPSIEKLGKNFGKVILEKDTKFRIKAYVNPLQKTYVKVIKSIPGRAWNYVDKYWSLPYVKETFEILEQVETDYQFKIKNSIPDQLKPLGSDFKDTKEKIWKKHVPVQLAEAQQEALNQLEDRLNLERKGWRTIKSYSSHLSGFLRYYPHIPPPEISSVQIQKYIIFKVVDQHIAESTQNQLINALKAYYERALGQADKVIYIPRPKKSKSLPNVFSKSEVGELINVIDNIKHKAMIALIYSAGLRKGEVIKLRLKDILYSRNCIFVKSAKGKKDRYVTLSKNAASLIKQYRQVYKPRYWLFEGQTGGNYSESALQSVFVSAKEKSNVNSYVTLHGLRHSYATHLFESGIPLNAIKDLLGHNSLKTTEIYMHISNKYLRQVQSPLDTINLT